MPADVEIRRFAGLFTDTADTEGELDRLIRAENTIFDEDGIIQARHGFHLFSNTAADEQVLQFIGKSDVYSQRLFLSDDGYYLWEGGKPSPSLQLITLAFTGGSRTSNVVTLTGLTTGHGLVIGDTIRVDAADNTYDGTFVLTGTAATTVTYAQTAANDASSGAGTIALVPIGVFGGNVGVEYAANLYFPEGRHWDSVGIRDTAQQPSIIQDGSMAVHAERLFLIDTGNSQARLYFSNPGDPGTWPAASFLDVDGGSGSLPVGLWSYQGRLFIFKRNDIFVLDTPGVPSTWILRRFARIGSQPGSITEYEGVLHWVGPDGAYRFDGSTITNVSEPIDDVFKSRDALNASEGRAESAVFRDQWVMRFPTVDTTYRCFCYNVKTQQWSEWTFPWETSTVFPVNFWSEETGVAAADADIEAGIYMTAADVGASGEGMLLGQEIRTNDYFRDEIGTRVAPTSAVEHAYSVVLQTKFSEFDEPLRMKRVRTWSLEWEGQDLLVEQIHARRGRVTLSVAAPMWGGEIGSSETLRGNITEPDHGPGIVVFFQTARGLGYTRKMSLRLTAQTIREAGFKLYRVAGRVEVKGRARRFEDEVTTDV